MFRSVVSMIYFLGSCRWEECSTFTHTYVLKGEVKPWYSSKMSSDTHTPGYFSTTWNFINPLIKKLLQIKPPKWIPSTISSKVALFGFEGLPASNLFWTSGTLTPNQRKKMIGWGNFSVLKSAKACREV